MNASTWSPATIKDEGISARDEHRKEIENGTAPFDFILTKNDRDSVAIAKVEIIAMKRRADALGLELSIVPISELTESERKAFAEMGVAL